MARKYRKEKYKTQEEWYAARGFGGSSASALFDANPYMTKLDIYCASVSNEKETFDGEEDNERTRYGKLAEPLIRDLVKINFANKFKVQSPNGFTMYRRKEKPYMTATLDGLMTDEVGSRWILEIKTHVVSSSLDYSKWQNTLPLNYAIQCLHYLAVLNDTVGCLLVAKLQFMDYDTNLVAKEEIRYYWLKREDYQAKIDEVERVETNFYENHIVPRIPPNVSIDLTKGD